jgi:hypothetical protein
LFLRFTGSGFDFWLVKTDNLSNQLWNKTYGGTSNDYSYSLIQTFEGNYAPAGYSNSFSAGGVDFWLVKTDGSGLLQSLFMVVRGADNTVYYRIFDWISSN